MPEARTRKGLRGGTEVPPRRPSHPTESAPGSRPKLPEAPSAHQSSVKFTAMFSFDWSIAVKPEPFT
ncbi:hypothetical protein KY5_3959 [Streptomyces formicae]|uniref:Uncharacterized protein n=1 Tax=Streptomyces formicae TaxID=1616117 RepID=A0A291QBW0_9ACTN|nr:hypothetical protein KY5_3959 [Streptomyces formicae]